MRRGIAFYDSSCHRFWLHVPMCCRPVSSGSLRTSSMIALHRVRYRLIGNRTAVINQIRGFLGARRSRPARLQIQLAVGLCRNAPRRRALYSFRDCMRIAEIVLVALPEWYGIGRWHLLDLMTERK